MRAPRLVTVFTLLAAGCAVISPLPDVRTPADRAHELDAKCRGTSEPTIAPLLTAAAIDSVEAAYARVLGGPNGESSRLRGAKVHVRPLPGMTRESMARDLECHQARVVLGAAASPTDDPFVLPDRWLTIDVDSERDGFVVTTSVDDLGDAQRALERARRFAAARASK